MKKAIFVLMAMVSMAHAVSIEVVDENNIKLDGINAGSLSVALRNWAPIQLEIREAFAAKVVNTPPLEALPLLLAADSRSIPIPDATRNAITAAVQVELTRLAAVKAKQEADAAALKADEEKQLWFNQQIKL